MCQGTAFWGVSSGSTLFAQACLSEYINMVHGTMMTYIQQNNSVIGNKNINSLYA